MAFNLQSGDNGATILGEINAKALDKTDTSGQTVDGDLTIASGKKIITPSVQTDLIKDSDGVSVIEIDKVNETISIYGEELSLINPPKFIAGDKLFFQSGIQNGSGTTYYKAYEKTSLNDGVLSTKLSIRSSNNSYTTYAKIYINDVAVGSERSNVTSSYVTFDENINVLAGDKIQIYIKGTNAYLSYFYLNLYIGNKTFQII